MIPSNRLATHSGVILRKEFLAPLGLSQKAVATHLGVPIQRINEIVRGKRGVSPDTAWLFSAVFNTSPEFWFNLQAAYSAVGGSQRITKRYTHAETTRTRVGVRR